MSDKKILFKKLDQILMGMLKYSFILGRWGEFVWVVIHLGDDGYSVKSFGVKPWEIRRFKSQTVCNSCLGDIYLSEYDYTTDSYNINFNPSIRGLRKNMREAKNIIRRDIETPAIDIYNIVVNSYLDQSKKYNKISIYLRRDVPDYNKIIKEIKESTIFGQSIPGRYESIDQPVFRFMALKGKKKDVNDGKIELSYPENYRFSYIVYG